MGRGHTDLVYPKFLDLVGVNVMHCRGEADDDPVISRDGNVVARVRKELRYQFETHGIVEDSVRNRSKSCVVTVGEKCYVSHRPRNR